MYIHSQDLECLVCGMSRYERNKDYDVSYNSCPKCGHVLSYLLGDGDAAKDGFNFVIDTLPVSPEDINELDIYTVSIKLKEWDEKYSSKYLALSIETEYDSDDDTIFGKLVYRGIRIETNEEKTLRLIQESVDLSLKEVEKQETKRLRYQRFLQLKAIYDR